MTTPCQFCSKPFKNVKSHIDKSHVNYIVALSGGKWRVEEWINGVKFDDNFLDIFFKIEKDGKTHKIFTSFSGRNRSVNATICDNTVIALVLDPNWRWWNIGRTPQGYLADSKNRITIPVSRWAQINFD